MDVSEKINDVKEHLFHPERYELPVTDDLRYEIGWEEKGIKFNYYFGGEPLVIPQEGVTMIGGLASHGKSTLLRNLAIDLLRDKDLQGEVLFFTYEESKRRTLARLTNTYIGESLGKGKNVEYITDFARTLTPDKNLAREKARSLEDKYYDFNSLYMGGRIRVFAVEDSSRDLVRFLREYGQFHKIKAVFIDYIQRMTSGGKQVSRAEDMRLVAQDLQDYTKETQIPVIVAAQLNRATNSPIRMGTNNIAESADLSRYAEMIICLWNSTKIEDVTDDKFLGSKEESRLKKLGFELGKSGAIYAKITKNKSGESGLEAVFDFDGNTEQIGKDMPDLSSSEDYDTGDF